MTHFAFANYAAAVLWGAPASLLPLLVTNLAGPAAAAYFYVATAVSGLVAMIPWAVSASLFAHGSHDEQQLVRYVPVVVNFLLVQRETEESGAYKFLT